MLLPGDAPPRRADSVQVVLTALLAHHDGAGTGRIAADLGVPIDTVRSWLPAVTGRAEWLRQEATRWACLLDPEHPPIQPTGSRLGDALSALGHAAAAARRRLNVTATPWQLIGVICARRLLAPLTPTRSG